MKKLIFVTLFPIMTLGLCACGFKYFDLLGDEEVNNERMEKRVFRKPSLQIDLSSFSQAPMCPCGNTECKGH